MRSFLVPIVTSGLVALGVVGIGTWIKAPAPSAMTAVDGPSSTRTGTAADAEPDPAANTAPDAIGAARDPQVAISEELARLAERIGELEHGLRRVERVQQDLRRIEWELNALQHRQVPPTEASPTLTRDGVMDEEADLLADQQNAWHHIELLEQRFLGEVPDRAWGAEMVALLDASLRQLPAMGMQDTEMVYHECRGTLCTAEFIHADGEDPRFLSTALVMPGIEQITVIPGEPLDNGEKVSTVYFYREGFGPE
jgi:hypothetical protein